MDNENCVLGCKDGYYMAVDVWGDDTVEVACGYHHPAYKNQKII